jgi:tetratricopeptide (TPR) repeat protein
MNTVPLSLTLRRHRAFAVCLALSMPAFADAANDSDPKSPEAAEPTSAAGEADSAKPAASEAAAEGPLLNPFVIPPQQRKGDFFVNGEDPENTVPPKMDTMTFGYYMMELADKGVEAFQRKEYDRAEKFYRTMAKLVPDKAVGFSKLCESYEASGKLKEAEEACGQAIKLQGTTVADHARYVELYLRNRPELLPAEVSRVDELIAHIATQEQAKLLAARLECRLGAHMESEERLEKCTTVLNEMDYHNPLHISFNWALAISRNDRDAAARELARAEAAGLPESALQSMRVKGERLLARGMSPTGKLALFGVGCVVMLGAAGTFFARRRREVASA